MPIGGGLRWVKGLKDWTGQDSVFQVIISTRLKVLLVMLKNLYTSAASLNYNNGTTKL